MAHNVPKKAATKPPAKRWASKAAPAEETISPSSDHLTLQARQVLAPRPRGRQTSYKAEFAAIARGMCRMGATDQDLANELHVCRETIIAWRGRHADFAAACEIGKEAADDRVERSFYQVCVGYQQVVEKIVNDAGTIIRVETVEQVGPDGNAAYKWLAARRNWRQGIDHGLNDDAARLLAAIAGRSIGPKKPQGLTE